MLTELKVDLNINDFVLHNLAFIMYQTLTTNYVPDLLLLNLYNGDVL